MTSSSTKRQDRLSADIRRQIGDRAISRLMQAMPAFRVVTDIPDHLRELLDRLEEREAPGRRRR